MKILKNILLGIIKLLIALHAVFWIAFDAYVINRFSSGNHISLPAFIIMLFMGFFLALAPMVLYRSVNRRFKFDDSTLSPLENTRNFINKYKYVRRHDALEVFENKDLQWKLLLLSLFVLLLFGHLSIMIEIFWVFYFFILIGFLPLAIRSFIRIIDRKPFLILTDDAIEFKLWNIDAINYSEIRSIDISTSTKVPSYSLYRNNLSGGVIAIKVSDANKIRIKSSSKLLNYLNSIGNDENLEIFTQLIEHDGADLVNIVKEKMERPQATIIEIVNNRMNEPYVPNKIPTWHRYINIIVSISVLSYAIYGLIVGKLIIPAKRGKYVELYGLASYVMFLAALFSAAYLLSFVMDHHDKRNNEKVYRKIQRYFYRCAWGAFCCAMLVSGYQHERDYVCRNEVVLKVASGDKNKTAYVAKRYCALHNPMNDPVPIYGVSVFDAQTAQRPDMPFNTARFNGYAVKAVHWEGNELTIEYGAVTTHELKAGRLKPSAHADSHAPVPVRLKKVIP